LVPRKSNLKIKSSRFPRQERLRGQEFRLVFDSGEVKRFKLTEAASVMSIQIAQLQASRASQHRQVAGAAVEGGDGE
jgi:hypothetical protein